LAGISSVPKLSQRTSAENTDPTGSLELPLTGLKAYRPGAEIIKLLAGSSWVASAQKGRSSSQDTKAKAKTATAVRDRKILFFIKFVLLRGVAG
jgi:hypothetical protein